MNYRLAYRIGFHPWEDAAENDAFVEKITRLFEAEEREREPPYGRALDVGTGSGIWGVELAKRGWQVTGIDVVDKALRRARKRIAQSGVEMELFGADVTDLQATDVGTGYRLVLDTGTFHGLTAARRRSMGQRIDAITTPDATVLLLVWEPKHRGPLPRGASPREIETAFPDWTVTDLGGSHYVAPKPVELLLTPNEHWYRLRRT